MVHGANPYGVLPPVPGLSFANVFSNNNTATIAYLPFWPFLTGLIYLAYSLAGWNDRFFYYFLLKQPIILADVALAYLLYSFVRARKPDKAAARWALGFWLFAPFTIMISGIWGMFDSIAICLVFLSIASTNRVKGSFWEGLAIFTKTLPIIYAVPLTVKRFRDLWTAILSISLAALLSLITFDLMEWPIRVVAITVASSAFKGGWSMSAWDVLFYMYYLGSLPNPNSKIYEAFGLLWIPALAAFTWIGIKRFRNQAEYGLIQALLLCTLAFLIFKARITEQYGLYLFALGVVDVTVWHPERRQLLLVTMGVAMVYLALNNIFLVRFLSPVYPGFVELERGIDAAFGPIRLALLTATGIVFTCLNVKYLAEVLKRR